MKKVIIALFVCGVVVFIVTFYRDTRVPSTSPTFPSKQATSIVPQSAKVASSDQTAAKAAKPRVLDCRQFNSRFNLTQTDAVKLNRSKYAVYLVLVELRGGKAKVTDYDGKHVRVTLPPLDAQSDQVAALLLSRLTESLGAEKAKIILSDPDGLETLYSNLEFDRFDNAVSFTFTKTKDYEPGASVDPAKEGAFDVERVETEGEKPGKDMRTSIKGFRLSDAYNYGLGWNALSKVPTGYFRQESIAGFKDAARGETVIFDESNDKAELLDSKYPGSVVQVKGPQS